MSVNNPRENSRLLPPVLHAVVGRECNLYFDSLPLPVRSERCEITIWCEQGMHLQKRWTWTPEAPGIHPMRLIVRDPQSKWQLDAALKIHAHPAPAKSLRYLAIGDSITGGGQYAALLKKFYKASDSSLTLCGTKTDKKSPSVRHEGYPGWKYVDFLVQRPKYMHVHATASEKSPFLYDGKISFADYVKKSLKGVAPDVITVFLGCNDIALIDEGHEKAIDEIVANARKFLISIAKGAPRAKIGVVLPLAPTPTQDAFGINYGCLLPRWRYVRNVHTLHGKMFRLLEKLSPRMEWVPVHLQVDAWTAYPVRKQRRNAHTKQTETVFCNAVHPTMEGYHQIAESIYCWMRGV